MGGGAGFRHPPAMKALAILYGGIAYLMFLASSLYAIGFVGNLAVPKFIDSHEDASLVAALVVDALLLGLFAIQHSVMARPAFKAFWTSIIPASVERATYVLVSSVLLFLVFWQWRAMPQVVWQVDSEPARMAILGLFWVGWLIAILSTFMVSHLDLFGLRQVMLDFQGKPYTQLPFMTRGLYRLVRHPLMLGFIVAFWAAPTMTLGHLFFAAATTAYILIALQFEEKDLLDVLGAAYDDYRRRVPMLLPWTKR
jgi:protein-S-isoprenylcysteine O-methyltransferase Ste14